jgi:glycosyltransferase involved in cell wall biosynthesis
MKFSVLIPLYYKEQPERVRAALESVAQQTLAPDEVVIVKDAGLPEGLERVVQAAGKRLKIRAVQMDDRVDLGTALQRGLLECSHDVVARVDTDDLSRADRFARQIEYLESNPGVDVIGSWVAEFDGSPDRIYAWKKFPSSHDEIRRFAKRRCPMGHMTMMFRKKAVLDAGNYQRFRGIGMEDYDLWVRMLLKGSRFANIPEPLVNACAGSDLSRRRGGLRHAYNEVMLQRRFLDLGFLTLWEFLVNLATRVPFVMIPSRLRFMVQRKTFRDSPGTR